MAITFDEDLLTLPQAAAEFPGRPHSSTVWRYAKFGFNGIVLETLRAGGKIFTSRQAVARFLAATNSSTVVTAPTEASKAKRRAEIEAAKARVMGAA